MTGLRARCVAVVGTAVLLATAACSGDPQAPAASRSNQPSSPAETSASPSRSASPSPTPTKQRSTRKPGPGRSYDPITGGKKSKKPVVAVKIDNVAQARPQVGVGAADMVVVERVEADLTRLMGIYHSRFPKRVGPVRSVRNTDLQLLPMFGRPALVFSGANGKVMKQVRKAPVKPVQRTDRDPSRVAPHDVVVDLGPISKQRGIGRAKPIGYTFAESDRVWRSAAKDRGFSIDVGVDSFGFRYVDGRYRTSWNDQPNTDADTGRRVLADNVVRLQVDSHHDNQTTSDESEVIETVGRGKATVYSGGKRLTGSWSRPKKSGPMRLTGGNGRDIPLHPGKTWILLDG